MIDIISNPKEFHSLKDEWNALPPASQGPRARHEWFETFSSAFGDMGNLKIFVARIGRVARAIVPMKVDRSGPVPRLRMLDDELGWRSPASNRHFLVRA